MAVLFFRLFGDYYVGAYHDIYIRIRYVTTDVYVTTYPIIIIYTNRTCNIIIPGVIYYYYIDIIKIITIG